MNIHVYIYPLLLEMLYIEPVVGRVAHSDDYDMSNSHGSNTGCTYILATTYLDSPWNILELVYLQLVSGPDLRQALL